MGHPQVHLSGGVRWETQEHSQEWLCHKREIQERRRRKAAPTGDRNEPEEGYGGWRWVCGVDDGAEDCGSGAGGCGVDRYFGGGAGRKGAGYGGERADHADGFVCYGDFNGERRLQRYGGERRGGDYGGISAEAGDEPGRFAEGELRRGEGGGGADCEALAEVHHRGGDESAGCDGAGGVPGERVSKEQGAGNGGGAGFGADERVRGDGVQGERGERALVCAGRAWGRHGAAAEVFDGGGDSPAGSIAEGAD